MTANFGAHEVMELHEVLTDTIDGINQFNLYREHVKDPQLGSILENQIQFMNQEYNNIIQAINQQGAASGAQYRGPKNISPVYGLRNPQPQFPDTSPTQLDDRDVGSGMLGCHKASASLKMTAALEIANPNLRRMVQQCAINSSEQAYDTWQYMNQKGYYQVPTMQQQTTNTIVNSYTTSPQHPVAF